MVYNAQLLKWAKGDKMAKSRTVKHAGVHVGKLLNRPLKKGGTVSNRKLRLKIAKKMASKASRSNKIIEAGKSVHPIPKKKSSHKRVKQSL